MKAFLLALTLTALYLAIALPVRESNVDDNTVPVLTAEEAQAPAEIPAAPKAKVMNHAFIVTLKKKCPLGSDGEKNLNAALSGYFKKAPSTRPVRYFLKDFPESAAVDLVKNECVFKIERNQRVQAESFLERTTNLWGLDRMNQRSLPLDESYTSNGLNGQNVNAYILDTGIRLTHEEFEGRAKAGFSTIEDGLGVGDCNGHGTHVAGIVGGKTMGVANKVTLWAVRTLDCEGGGSLDDLLSGIEWVQNNHIKPAVAVFSLGTPKSEALDNAMKNLVNAGVTVVVAAGNEEEDACLSSPANVGEAITVASIDDDDARSWFSNTGVCVDIWAPGGSILSASNEGDSLTSTRSGTSMSCPHVAGAAAIILQANPTFNPTQVSNKLLADSTSGVVSSPGGGSPNKLVYVESTSASAPSTPAATPQSTPAATTPAATPQQTTPAATPEQTTASATPEATPSATESTTPAATPKATTPAATPKTTTPAATPKATTPGATEATTPAATEATTPAATTPSGTSNRGRTTPAPPTATTFPIGGPCRQGECEKATGTLANGETTRYPRGTDTVYVQRSVIEGFLTGPAGTDFDLELFKWEPTVGINNLQTPAAATPGGTNGKWVSVSDSSSYGSDETIFYDALEGHYTWEISSATGSGEYTFWSTAGCGTSTDCARNSAGVVLHFSALLLVVCGLAGLLL